MSLPAQPTAATAVPAQMQSAFITALLQSDESKLQTLLEELPELANIREKRTGATPLIVAASLTGGVNVIEVLLPFSDKTAVDRAGLTPLMAAARQSRLDNMQVLLPHSEPTACDLEGKTALMHAVGNAACVEFLLPHSQGLAVDHQGRTALMFAAGDLEKSESVQPLKPVDPHAGVTLSAAPTAAQTFEAAKGNAQSVRMLLARSDASLRDQNGVSALDRALRTQSWDCVDLLAEHLPAAAAREVVRSAPDVALPQCRAIIEREELRQGLSLNATRLRAQTPSTQAAEATTPSSGAPKASRL